MSPNAQKTPRNQIAIKLTNSVGTLNLPVVDVTSFRGPLLPSAPFNEFGDVVERFRVVFAPECVLEETTLSRGDLSTSQCVQRFQSLSSTFEHVLDQGF